MSSITLTCNVTSSDGSAFTVTAYQWNTTGCYTQNNINGGNPTCFPLGHTTQSVSEDDLTAEDAGTITCIATISGIHYTSGQFTLRITGEHSWLVYCTIYIVYSMPALFYTAFVMYIFTVGTELIRLGTPGGSAVISANAIGDYSYVNSRSDAYSSLQLAHCVSGLGANNGGRIASTSGLYFNGTQIPFWLACNNPITPLVQPTVDWGRPGVINIRKCSPFTTDWEGIYTCTMRNSSMMDQSIRFGVYFDIRSELLDSIL